VTGVFTDGDGQPIGNATVVLTDATGHTFWATTAADGSFRIEGSPGHALVLGTATLSGTAADGERVTKSISVSEAVTVANLAQSAATPNQLAFSGRSGAAETFAAFALVLGVTLLVISRRRRRLA
jgi:hypothetical protein